MRKRPGRKRKDAARKPCGRLRHDTPDYGPTPEMAIKRRAMLGKKPPADNLAVDAPLDVLLAHGLIAAEQHRAGWSYAALQWWMAGKPFNSGTPLVAMIDGRGVDLTSFVMAGSKEWQLRYQRAEASRTALRAVGPRAFDAVDRVAVRQRFGAMERAALVAGRLLPKEVADIRRGLDAIAKALQPQRISAVA
jgi:hypothetical protein